MSRVCTYLNFPGNTEEAFLFYQSIFGGEFIGEISRFGDMPAQEGVPEFAEEVKHKVLHIELAILGEHILMGTDAPKEMGFTVHFGNNYYINLEPDTKAETKVFFEALSSGGQITAPLEDMYWGTYYGCCTDKFGVQWMFNCNEQH